MSHISLSNGYICINEEQGSVWDTDTGPAIESNINRIAHAILMTDKVYHIQHADTARKHSFLPWL